ncbi:MAG: hypothetical protein U0414_14420 [Polyangiaceae bacterium]
MFRRLSDRVSALDLIKPSGWRLTMHAVRLKGGGLLVHSPVRPHPEVFDALEALGTPSILLAPNHFHHVALPRYRERYPKARALASAGARPRLARKGHADLGDIAGEKLPGVRLLPCEHVKNGETMVVVDDEGGPTLLVCDAFFNVPGPLTGFEGWFLRMTSTGPDLSLGKTYRFAGIGDPRAYAAWLEETLAEIRPRRVSFSHGDPIEGDDVVDRLLVALRRALE